MLYAALPFAVCALVIWRLARRRRQLGLYLDGGRLPDTPERRRMLIHADTEEQWHKHRS